MAHESVATTRGRFSMVEVWADTASEIRRNGAVLLQAAAIPALAIGLLNLFATPPEQGGIEGTPGALRFFFTLISAVIGAVLAVSCHRIVLRGPHELANPWGLYLDGRVGAYVLTLIGLTLLFMVALVLLGVLPIIASTSYPLVGFALFGAVFLVCFYGMLRLSLVLPARAIGEEASFDDVLRWTRDRSIRVVFAIFLPAFLISLLLIPVELLIINGTAGPGFRWLPSALLSMVMGVVAAVTLSCTYRRIRPARPDDAGTVAPPIPPPYTRGGALRGRGRSRAALQNRRQGILNPGRTMKWA